MAHNRSRNIVYIRAIMAVLLFHCSGEASRYLPVIIWDHLNSLLNCRCNWLTIPKIDLYDEIPFTCPSMIVPVRLLNGFSRPRDIMNENIFRRKWTGTKMEELRDSLNDGSFCDPKHPDTKKVFTCKNGETKSHVEMVTEGFDEGDIFVFFNNVDDGKAKSLSSTQKKCTMVFAMNVTWKLLTYHDMSYGKCFNPEATVCKNISTTCMSTCDRSCPFQSPNFNPSTVSPTPTQPQSAKNEQAVRWSTSSQATSPMSSKVVASDHKEPKEQRCHKLDRFGYGVLAGVPIGCFISGMIAAVVVYISKKRNARRAAFFRPEEKYAFPDKA